MPEIVFVTYALLMYLENNNSERYCWLCWGEWPQSGHKLIFCRNKSITTKFCHWEGSKSNRGNELKVGRSSNRY